MGLKVRMLQAAWLEERRSEESLVPRDPRVCMCRKLVTDKITEKDAVSCDPGKRKKKWDLESNDGSVSRELTQSFTRIQPRRTWFLLGEVLP